MTEVQYLQQIVLVYTLGAYISITLLSAVIFSFIIQVAWNWVDDIHIPYKNIDIWVCKKLSHFYFRFPDENNNYYYRSKKLAKEGDTWDLKDRKDYISKGNISYSLYFKTVFCFSILPSILLIGFYLKVYVAIVTIFIALAYTARYSRRLAKTLKKHIENIKIHK